MDIFVYMITVKPVKKSYVGKTGNYTKRIASHKSESKKSNKELYNDIREYGWSQAETKILGRYPEEIAKIKENEFIIKHKTNQKKFGYNIRTDRVN